MKSPEGEVLMHEFSRFKTIFPEEQNVI